MPYCSSKSAKFLFIALSSLFWIFGCALVGLGCCIITNPAKIHFYHAVTAQFDDASPEPHTAQYIAREGLICVAYALISIGVAVVVSGFIGCCGVIQERKSLLVLNFIYLFLLMCAELALAIITIIYREEILSGMESRLTLAMQNLYAQDTGFTNSIDYSQFKFQCCGSRGGGDYSLSKWRNISSIMNKTVPLTCCPLINYTDDDAYLNPKPFDPILCQEVREASVVPVRQARYEQGCYDSLESWFQRDSSVIIGAGLIMAFLEVVGMILTICLCRLHQDLD